MELGFWAKLNKPLFVLAPMADVTDAAFRRIIAEHGRPDVTWTEFVSADGLAHPIAREKLLIDLVYTEAERPIVAQLFSSNPENMRAAAQLCAELGFDGIDINMGCPDKSIERQGAGAGMIKNPEVAVAVIRAAREGAPHLPISVKTRIGYNKNQIQEWLPVLLGENLAALTVHLRTRKEMSKVAAHWDLMPEIVTLRDKLAPDTLILGNGDARDLTHARELVAQTGCDGVMLGRAIFGNPWLFSGLNSSVIPGLTRNPGLEPGPWSGKTQHIPTLREKLLIMCEHTKQFEKLLGPYKSFAIMKKHYKAYVNGFPGAAELRQKLFDQAETATDVQRIVEEYLVTSTN